MALKGVKVLEFAGLAPVPFCGMVLADFGATVTRIDRFKPIDMDIVGSGKKSIAVDLKKPAAVSIIKKLSQKSDVLIDPFRPGVLEKLGLGPQVLCTENPKLIYSRLTGYGSHGLYAKRAGHDINYTAMSGLLSLLGRSGEKPMFPMNFAADFAGGGLVCAFGIVMALYERSISGKGQVIDCNMTEGAAYVASWLARGQDNSVLFSNPRGENLLDGGAHFYDVYETKDNKYVAVGALEPQFYQALLEGLNLSADEVPYGDFEDGKKILEKKFMEKTRDEWCKIFDHKDACVTPVLGYDEVAHHPHNKERNSFITHDNVAIPIPAPRLSRTPGESAAVKAKHAPGEDTVDILKEYGYTSEEIQKLEGEGVIKISQSKL